MALLLSTSTCRGYMARIKANGWPSDAFDCFGSRAIYIGEDTSMKSILQPFLHIDASPTPGVESRRAMPMSEEMALRFQNQLLDYRLASAHSVYKSDFYVSGLSPDANAIATALGRCIVDAPELQAELVALLTPFSEQQIAERRDDLGTLAVGAALSLCHQGKDQILVGEIAAEVNRMLKAGGEKLQFSAEKVGHRLKKAGLISRRLGAAGNGFVLDHATRVLIHEVAAAYGCVGSTNDKENTHCPLCEQIK